jgi:hypothetical protein
MKRYFIAADFKQDGAGGNVSAIVYADLSESDHMDVAKTTIKEKYSFLDIDALTIKVTAFNPV